MKRQRAEISSNVISHIKSAHPIEICRSDKLGIKEKNKSREFPSTYFFFDPKFICATTFYWICRLDPRLSPNLLSG